MATPRKPAARPAPAKPGPFDETRPDAPVTRVVTHARSLARQLRVDVADLTRAKLSLADADRLDAAADAVAAAEEAWIVAKDARSRGAVAKARKPLRKGRDQIFAALRTFAPDDRQTQDDLDQIGRVNGDDDLAEDTSGLLRLATKHAGELAGTDLDAARLAEIQTALDEFAAVRIGRRPDGTTAQAEAVANDRLRCARNRAFWALAALDRQVCSYAQYAFRADAVRRARYAFYRRNAAPAEKKPT